MVFISFPSSLFKEYEIKILSVTSYQTFCFPWNFYLTLRFCLQRHLSLFYFFKLLFISYQFQSIVIRDSKFFFTISPNYELQRKGINKKIVSFSRSIFCFSLFLFIFFFFKIQKKNDLAAHWSHDYLIDLLSRYQTLNDKKINPKKTGKEIVSLEIK